MGVTQGFKKRKNYIKMAKQIPPAENFSDKYLKSNFIIKKLIENFYESIKDIFFEIEVDKILEVGCGSGFSTQYLREFLKDKNFEASEYGADLVKEAQKRNPGVKIQQESIYELKRDSNSFDLIVALEVLEHLQDPESALRELHRVTSKYCLISVPQEPLWRILNICRFEYLKDLGNSPGHLQHWSKKQFSKFVSNYFKVEKMKTSLPWLIILGKK